QRAPIHLLYVDSRPLTRDCMGQWLSASLAEFQVSALASIDEAIALAAARGNIGLIALNVSAQSMMVLPVRDALSALTTCLPNVPVAVFGDSDEHGLV